MADVIKLSHPWRAGKSFRLVGTYIPLAYRQKYRADIVETEYTKVLVTKGVGTVCQEDSSTTT